MSSVLVGDVPAWLIYLGAFLFGALWGSFFNVAIYRWPLGMSVVTPPSHCPSCGTPVSWFRNVPIVNYLLSRGRASCCGAKLTGRYVVVELLGAMLCLAIAHQYVVLVAPSEPIGPRLVEALLLFAFAGALIVATFTDLEHMMIPDEVSLPGAALGLATVGLRSQPTALEAAVGAGTGYLFVQLVLVYAYEHFRGVRAMGEGDAKLLLMIGAFLGWKGMIFTFLAGQVQGLLIFIVLYVTGSRTTPPEEVSFDPGPHNDDVFVGATCQDRFDTELPEPPKPDPEDEAAEDGDEMPKLKLTFGPLLALGALEFLFFGDVILDWYFGLM